MPTRCLVPCANRHRTTNVVSTIAIGESIAIVLISSPARMHPSTDMTWRTLGTTCMLDGLDRCPIQIVCDGYRTPTDLDASHAARILPQLERDPAALSKKGIVRGDMGDAYEKYKAQLHIDIAERGLSERVSVDELGSHHGFAMCVRHALERCDRRFALIMQHDRCFIRGLATHDLARILADAPCAARHNAIVGNAFCNVAGAAFVDQTNATITAWGSSAWGNEPCA